MAEQVSGDDDVDFIAESEKDQSNEVKKDRLNNAAKDEIIVLGKDQIIYRNRHARWRQMAQDGVMSERYNLNE